MAGNRITGVVYIGHDNPIVLKLYEDDAIVDVSNITRVVLDLGPLSIDSQSNPLAVSWDETTEEVILKLGTVSELASHAGKTFRSRLIVYRSDATNGIVWLGENDSFYVRINGAR